jgi:hypothetical protein
MGATISTAKLAAAFKGDNGNTYYALFEQSFEKNCYPHTPSWCCVSIGSIATTLQRVFGSAAACAGGDLRVRGGRSEPAQYIADWLTELATPVLMPDASFSLRVGKDFYAPIPEEKASEILLGLTEDGHAQVARILQAGGSCEGTIYANPDLVEAVYGSSRTAPWRIVRNTPLLAARTPQLGYRPTPSKAAVPPPPAFLKVDSEARLIRQDDGSWRYAGWEYQAIGNFVQSLWKHELQEPGTYRKLIRAFTKAAKDAPAIPANTKVVVDTQVSLESAWERRAREELPKYLAGIEVTPTATGYEFPAPRDASALFRVCGLAKVCATWVCASASVQGELLAA